jgi:3-isopropylmalate/(R)-2-methylmalate dehydratase small subunit
MKREPFTTLRGVMAPMLRTNINTDAIIPSPWLRFAKADLGKGLFGAERYDASGAERPDFVLNRGKFRNARMLLADENFGCGSSREAAVWALAQFGIRCVLAPSFADIFYENAFRNGVLAARVTPDVRAALATALERHAGDPVFTVDLAARRVIDPDGAAHEFRVPDLRAEALMRGDDEIAATLRHLEAIEAFHAGAQATRPWLYPQSSGT